MVKCLCFKSSGSFSKGVSTWTPDTQLLINEESNGSNSTQMSINNKSNDKDPLWMILMDQSQLVMTIVGLVANVATTLTLIKNGQVSGLMIWLLATNSLSFWI